MSWGQADPALVSLMVPVRGDFPPTEMRALVGAAVPVTIPGAKTTLLLGPRGWQFGSTSSHTMLEVSQRPPLNLYFSGTSWYLTAQSFMLTRRILAI